MATFVLEMDHDRDGDFSEASEDISAYVVRGSCFRGKDDASNLKGESVAGTLQVELLNLDGAWSKFNAASPFFGSLKPGLKIRLRSTAPTAAVMWTGFLDHVDPTVHNKALPRATLYAHGLFAKFVGENARINPPALTNVLTGDVIDQILDTADHPAADRDLDTGSVPVGRWYPGESEALGLLREMEEQEGGELYEDLDWGIAFRGRYDRLLNHATSVATFTDDGVGTLGYREISQADPLKNVFNKFEATITPHSIGALAVLWTLSETFSLAAGESRSYFATVGEGVAYADPWTTPVVGTDVLQTGVSNGDIAVTASKFAKSMKITVTNNHASASATITLQARGVPILVADAYKIEAEDQDSIDDYGPRRFPFTSPWFPNSAYAQASLDFELLRHKDEHPILTKTILGNTDALFAQCAGRDLGDRVTIEAESDQTQLGISADFHIESIAHVFGARMFLRTTFALSEAIDVLDGADPFILDASELDGADVLVY